MRDHSFDADEAALRPRSARLEEQVAPAVGLAAQERRTDVLGAPGLLDLQRSVGNAGVAALVEDERSPVHDVVASGGRPLDPAVREDMEGRLGHDFGDVRIHDDAAAHDSARAVNAHAYTVGSNVVFQRDTFDPSTDDGRVMLAHELTHVVQQRSGPVAGTPAPGGIQVSDPSDHFEREAASTAEHAVRGAVERPTAQQPAAAVQRDADDTVASVQREDEAPAPSPEEEREPEEEPPAVQGAFLQRDEEPEADDEATG